MEDEDSQMISQYNQYSQGIIEENLQVESIQQEQEDRQRRERALWYNQYITFDRLSSQRRASQNNNERQAQQQPHPEHPFESEYEERVFNLKNSCTGSFIEGSIANRQEKLTFSRIDVYFPKKPYDQQKKYMNHVIQCLNQKQNGFLESPTGTGKTFCMLTSTLAWVHHQKTLKKHYRIIYLTRTHSQIQQVQKELLQTCYRPTMTVMGSRDHFCINENIDRENITRHQLKQKCSEARKNNFQLNQAVSRGLEPQAQLQLQLNSCRHYKGRYQTVQIGKGFLNKIWDIEEIKIKGQGHFCPYYYPIYMQEYCDLILMPYNYLLNVSILERYSGLIKDSIIIFDEAHNVADSACDGRSFQLRLSNLDGFIREMQNLKEKPAKYQADKGQLQKKRTNQLIERMKEVISHIQDIKQSIMDCLNQISFSESQDEGNKPQITKLFYQPKEKFLKWSSVVSSENVDFKLVEILHYLSDIEKDQFRRESQFKKEIFERLISKLQFIIDTKQQIAEELKQIRGFSFFHIGIICKFFKRVVQLIRLHMNNTRSVFFDELRHYCLVFSVELGKQVHESTGRRNIKDYSVSLNCLVPWFTFEEIKKYSPYSILFTSGTISPIDQWSSELNLTGRPFTNNHVISNHQIKLNVISHNMNGIEFDFTSKKMNDNRLRKYQSMLGMIVSIVKQIQGGVIVIFPNYRFLEDIKKQLKDKFLRFNQHIENTLDKKQFFEQKSNLRQINAYKKHIQSGRSAILYGVCRGKASEGIDFPDNLCRAVIYIGIPFPNDYSPFMLQKKLHYKKLQGSTTLPELRDLNWSAYYFNSMIRSINQGLGRAIRHKFDYGQLFLIDCRYLIPYYGYVKRRGQRNRVYRQYLPSWATNQGQYDVWGEDSENIIGKLKRIKQFYDFNKEHTKPPVR